MFLLNASEVESIAATQITESEVCVGEIYKRKVKYFFWELKFENAGILYRRKLCFFLGGIFYKVPTSLGCCSFVSFIAIYNSAIAFEFTIKPRIIRATPCSRKFDRGLLRGYGNAVNTL